MLRYFIPLILLFGLSIGLPIEESKGLLSEQKISKNQEKKQNKSNYKNFLNKRTKQNKIVDEFDDIFKDLLKKPELKKLYGLFGKTVNGAYNFDMDMLLENGNNLNSSVYKKDDKIMQRTKRSVKNFSGKNKKSVEYDENYRKKGKKEETEKKQTSLLSGINYMSLTSPIGTESSSFLSEVGSPVGIANFISFIPRRKKKRSTVNFSNVPEAQSIQKYNLYRLPYPQIQLPNNQLISVYLNQISSMPRANSFGSKIPSQASPTISPAVISYYLNYIQKSTDKVTNKDIVS